NHGVGRICHHGELRNMISSRRVHRLLLATQILVAGIAASVHAQKTSAYFPPAGSWQRKMPAEVGMDSIKLQAAIDFAQAHNSTWDFERDQVRTFGRRLGPLPTERAATNGIIVRHGYVVPT